MYQLLMTLSIVPLLSMQIAMLLAALSRYRGHGCRSVDGQTVPTNVQVRRSDLSCLIILCNVKASLLVSDLNRSIQEARHGGMSFRLAPVVS